MALAVAAVVGAVALLAQPGALEAQSHTATRTFQQAWAMPGGELRVAIAASNYGAIGQVVETLPDGFALVSSSLGEAQEEVAGQTVRFNLLGDRRFTYVVSVPSAEGHYTFAGVIRNVDRAERTIAGHTRLRVGPPPTPSPTATPGPATSTPTREPTATAPPEPTAMPTPEPTATPVPTETSTPPPTPAPTVTPEPTVTPAPTATPHVIVVVAPTAAPTATATVMVATVTPEAEAGLPGILWFIPVIVLIGLILAIFSYRRTRS